MTFFGKPKTEKSSGASQLKEILLWLVGRRKRFKIEGQSMKPLLKQGDVVFVKPTREAHPGDLVICRHPIQSDLILVKQVAEVYKKTISIKGLNPSESSDSRTFGPINKSLVMGTITSKIRQK